MTVGQKILRRAIVSFVTMGIFLAWMFQRTPLPTFLLITGVMLLASALFGVILSWPRNRWLRVLEVLALVVIIGFARADFDAERPSFSLVVALITGTSVVYVLAVIFVLDLIAAAIHRKLARKTAVAETR